MRISISPVIKTFLKVYFIVIAVFTFFRIILFSFNFSRLGNQVSIVDILHSFLMGLRFDTVITCYIFIVPFVIFSIIFFLKWRVALFQKIVFWYLFSFFSMSFLACAIDIPTFNQFFNRLTVSAFEWFDSPLFVLKMVFGEFQYWFMLIPLVLIIVGFFFVLKKIFNFKIIQFKQLNLYGNIFISILCVGFIILGIRGRIEKKSPIKVGTAYFCSNPLLNQLGLNPNFTLIRSTLDKLDNRNESISLIDETKAFENIHNYLNIDNKDIFSLIRKENYESDTFSKANVVIVLMESMTAAKMQHHGNQDHLTPFLDSIADQGYYFENCYSAGIHTFNGIFSTLFSLPALFCQHPMKESAIYKYNGIYTALKSKGYSTVYFTTHDGQFDNVEGFLKENDCDLAITQPDYPSDKVKTVLGVPDDYMFEYSIPILTKLSQHNTRPFVAVMSTASNHGPYYIPEYFKPHSKDIHDQAFEYADYSLRKLVSMASKQEWFSNTLFVFIADHGQAKDATYDVSLAYNHIPFIMYSPTLIKEPKKFSCMAGQIDVFPTIMGMLKIPFDNENLGINLLKNERPYIFFNVDDKYAVIDKEWLLIKNKNNNTGLYKYKQQDKVNYANDFPKITEEMDVYAKSNIQVAQHIMIAKALYTKQIIDSEIAQRK